MEVGFFFKMYNPKAGRKAFKFKPWLGLRRISPFRTEHNSEGRRIRIFWRRLFLWVTVLLCMTWLGVTGGLYFYIKYARDYGTLEYTNLLFYPWKKDVYRRARCEFLLKKGKEQLNERKYLEGFYNIRLGLSVVPEDTEAREQIAQFYIAIGRDDAAEQTFSDGLQYNASNIGFLRKYFEFLFSRQKDERVIEITQHLLASEARNTLAWHVLTIAQASADFYLGRYKIAEKLLFLNNTMGTRGGSILTAQVMWAQGKKTEALALLSDLSDRFPGDPEVYVVRVGYFREVGNMTAIRSLAVLRQLEKPDDPSGYLDELSTLDPSNETVRRAGTLSELFSRFSNDGAAMNGLASIGAYKGQIDLAWRAYRQCKVQDLPCMGSAISYIEAHLVAKLYADAIAATQKIVAENQDWVKTNGTQLDALRSVANYALGDKALSELQLQNYLNDKNTSRTNLVAFAEHMVRVGALGQARLILLTAIKTDSLNQAALTRLVELDLEQMDTPSLVANTDRLLVMRKPDPAFLRKIRDTLQSDRYIFEGNGAMLQKINARLAQYES